MYRRILVPLEAEGGPDAHLRHVERLAAHVGAEVVLLRVIPVVSADEHFFQAIQVEEGSSGARRSDVAREYLDRLVAQLREKGLSVRSEVLITSKPEDEAIVEFAQEQGCDLIALPNERRSLISRWLQGNVPARVQRRSPVPILLVRGVKGGGG
ncbi:MAG TPA: universal stress protein [Chloroflexi bacterium]|nr:universal stress protein [Chloroflexota bacterium]